MRDTFRAFTTTIGFGFRAAPRHAAAQIAMEVLLSLAGPAIAYGGKLLVDAAVDGEARPAVIATALISAIVAGLIITIYYSVHCSFCVLERSQVVADRKLMRLIGGIHGLAHHEQSEYLDQVQRIREERESLAGMVNATAGLGSAVLGFVATAVLLARVHPGLLALVLLAVVSLLIARRANDLAIEAQEDTSETERLRRHLYDVGTAAPAGKELRVFGLVPELLTRHHRASDDVLDARNRADWRAARLGSLDALVNAAGFIGAIVAVLLLAMDGRATPGDVVLVVGLAMEMGEVISRTAEYGGEFLWTMEQARRLVWLERYAEDAAAAPADPAAPPAALTTGINLTDVTFRYPGSDRPVLENVSLHLPAGSVVSLVGDNGAGKTSLVKLLCDFYRPDEGQIIVDGRDLRDIPSEEWRDRVTGAFQDYVDFEFRARESVGVSSPSHIGDDAVLHTALDRADATAVVGGLPRGLDTQLGTTWGDGTDLSGGQWQRLALARGLLRPDPLLVVFDEPTAALDAQTEHALFDRFARAARAGAGGGTITLLVSHRFSTARMADIIVVLDGGRIREIGSHEELMSRGGLYAELYDIQSRAYLEA
ncbi:ABC transporter ATP-binding protein [Actinomadura darangshiensis]|uniref:ABC transporter ATP-binding protein n=1 Tax=Actinomadura darangshiensis TaxID=705336 RepID=A0A4R5BAQ3_9ACTN|nr:ABC transporter ATP-binding protein [Actinomadura darangshiensis]TDD83151.1 ABC transporter ATP-binding protein [Actinomadura darangshiensis]